MIALGYIERPALLRAPLSLMRGGNLYLVCCSMAQGKTALQRLALIVQCYNAGLDIVPIAPRVAVTASQALHQSKTMDLTSKFEGLRQTGQLTVSTSLGQKPSCACHSGRDWLFARRRQHVFQAELKSAVLDTLNCYGKVKSNIASTGNLFQCDLLIMRQDEAAVKAALRKRMHGCAILKGASIAITGVWPPFGFTGSSKVLAA